MSATYRTKRITENLQHIDAFDCPHCWQAAREAVKKMRKDKASPSPGKDAREKN